MRLGCTEDAVVVLWRGCVHKHVRRRPVCGLHDRMLADIREAGQAEG